ncbi:hypothetical protein [Lysobacter sp. CA199]|uniref:hypothetical protein n=1 Tax=Lysobacter sp. CA199 TaxID=3455608 RepID=UPI003F8CF63C
MRAFECLDALPPPSRKPCIRREDASVAAAVREREDALRAQDAPPLSRGAWPARELAAPTRRQHRDMVLALAAVVGDAARGPAMRVGVNAFRLGVRAADRARPTTASVPARLTNGSFARIGPATVASLRTVARARRRVRGRLAPAFEAAFAVVADPPTVRAAAVGRSSRPKKVRALSRNRACATRNPGSSRRGIFSSGTGRAGRLRSVDEHARAFGKKSKRKTRVR